MWWGASRPSHPRPPGRPPSLYLTHTLSRAQASRLSGVPATSVLVPIATLGDVDPSPQPRSLLYLPDADLGGGWIVAEERLEQRLKRIGNIAPKLFYGPELAAALAGERGRGPGVASPAVA